MYYCDINSYCAGQIVQCIMNNLSKKTKFCYDLSYDHKNGWREDQDVYELDAIMEIVAEKLHGYLTREVHISCEYLPFGWQIVVEVGD